MMRVDPFFNLGLNGSLNNLTAQQNSLTTELSSGLAVSSASDNPLAAAEGLQLGSAISRDDAYVASATGWMGRLQVSDSALGSVVSQVTAAISLATSGLSGTLNGAQTGTISTQMASIRDEVLGLANTSYAGNYLFGGTSSATAPFVNSAATTPSVATYSGDGGQQFAETPTGQKIAVSLPGSGIFTAAGSDVLGSLNRLVADFAGGAPAATTQADMNELSAGLATVTTQRSVLGTSLSSLQATSGYASTDSVNLQATQSSLVAANTTTIATDLSTSETQEKALMSVMSIPQTSLFATMQF
jgi:flagellar hook-associated protein 3 FlgL